MYTEVRHCRDCTQTLYWDRDQRAYRGERDECTIAPDRVCRPSNFGGNP